MEQGEYSIYYLGNSIAMENIGYRGIDGFHSHLGRMRTLIFGELNRLKGSGPCAAATGNVIS